MRVFRCERTVLRQPLVLLLLQCILPGRRGQGVPKCPQQYNRSRADSEPQRKHCAHQARDQSEYRRALRVLRFDLQREAGAGCTVLRLSGPARCAKGSLPGQAVLFSRKAEGSYAVRPAQVEVRRQAGGRHRGRDRLSVGISSSGQPVARGVPTQRRCGCAQGAREEHRMAICVRGDRPDVRHGRAWAVRRARVRRPIQAGSVQDRLAAAEGRE